MLTWLKSSLPTLRNLSKSNRDRLRPSCAACQSRRRRQQVIPLQKPTSWDSAAPGTLVHSTKTMLSSSLRVTQAGPTAPD